MVKKTTIKNILLFALWSVIGAGTIVLLVAAIQIKDAHPCSGVQINIDGVSNNFFVDKQDILQTIATMVGGKPEGKKVADFNLSEMEQSLEKNIWVKNAQLFFDNNEQLQVNVLEREPVARVFTSGGTTFYLDSSMAILPLSEKFSARLPVFTNFPSDKKVLLKADSILVKDIITVSLALQQDPFCMSMIDQVDITPQRGFEMIPKIGNTIIVFGGAENVVDKLSKLRLFYKEVVAKAGWNHYSEINVQYSNQVVAKRKGEAEVKADSLHTLQLMKLIAENAERMATDSLQTIQQDNEHNTTSNSIIQQSIQREDNAAATNGSIPSIAETLAHKKPVVNMVVPDSANKKNLTDIKKPPAQQPEKKETMVKKNWPIKPSNPLIPAAERPTTTETKQPKMVMPKSLPHKSNATKQVNEY